MHVWDRIVDVACHPRLAVYSFRRKHFNIPPNAEKEKRLDKFRHPRRKYPGVDAYLESCQSLVTREHVGFA
jgi:hypothetical protein